MTGNAPESESAGNASPRLPLHRQVQDAIRDFILSNDLAPGDGLPSEGQLAELLGVSRNSVREGVKALEVQGVIEARVGSGLFVRSFSFDPILDGLPYGLLVDLDTVGHLLHLREVLDLGASNQIVGAVAEEQLAVLSATLEQWAEAAAAGEYPAELDRRFHAQLYGELDNPLLQKLSNLFWDAFQHVSNNATIPDLPDMRDPGQTLELHRDIYEALADRDADRLRSAISAHYPGIWSALT